MFLCYYLDLRGQREVFVTLNAFNTERLSSCHNLGRIKGALEQNLGVHFL